MSNLAILIGNTEYQNLSRLECCTADVVAMRELLDATEKFNSIVVIVDASADSLKDKLRDALDEQNVTGELFLYFTGHGLHVDTEFYFCATDFDARKPNETGLSTSELHTILRPLGASLIVKVIDACNSGTSLIKRPAQPFEMSNKGFKNIIQISSSLESQSSYGGDPLSLFTDRFRSAALRKTEGSVFYTDIISSLRDDFAENGAQTPFFVSQGTGREKFVDDAAKLLKLRGALLAEVSAADEPADSSSSNSILLRLRSIDERLVTTERLNGFVQSFFEELGSELDGRKSVDLFEIEKTEYASFEELAAEKFIARVLSSEKRLDSFVSATYSRKNRNSGGLGLWALGGVGLPGEPFDEVCTLKLNCTMQKAQVRYRLTPKFLNLQRISLIVTCAPSLDRCYIFEHVTQHMLEDFDRFEPLGSLASQRWWRLSWDQSSENVVKQIASMVDEVVASHLDATEKRWLGDK